ncbi:MAG: GIY-YIG nuclease family protein [Candidatus Riflebacteria bacterium]|nr:GIY-YIG nuclease family protein [Candidatus Riflebacteria bacterium]
MIEHKNGWVLYILECADGSFYTGVTNDLTARLACHNTGKAARYTRGRLPVRLVYHEVCEDRSAAQRREHAVKRLSRSQKEALMINKGC